MATSRVDSEKIGVHATFLSCDGCGVLLCGDSGSGKSDLALALLVRHQATLISDDYTELFRQGEHLVGRAAPAQAGLLHLRDLGPVDVRRLWGIDTWQPQQVVQLVVVLDQMTEFDSAHIIGGRWDQCSMLGVAVPRLHVCVTARYALPDLVLTAARMRQPDETTIRRLHELAQCV